MGRHSSPNQSHFYRSLFGWIGLWAMLAVATAVAVWFVVNALGGSDTRTIAGGEPTRARQAEPDPTVSGLRVAKEEPAEDTTADDTSTEEASTDPAASRDTKEELVTDGISVQVLNGTMKGSAGQAMADRLTKLGYTVVAVEESSRVYPQTTVFWSTDQGKKAAQALADAFGWVAEPKPANLSDSVTFHVVVGADEG